LNHISYFYRISVKVWFKLVLPLLIYNSFMGELFLLAHPIDSKLQLI